MQKHELKNIRLQFCGWEDLPDEIQEVFISFLGGERESGKTFYELYFYWFNIAHEIGHVLRAQHQNAYTNVWEEENAVNLFAVAYWRAKGQTNRLFQLENSIRQVLANLPNPVPADQDRMVYLLNHFQELGNDPAAYGHYQWSMVRAALERPLSFPLALKTLIAEEANDCLTIPLAPDTPIDSQMPRRTVDDMRKTLAAYNVQLPEVQIICQYAPALQFILWDKE